MAGIYIHIPFCKQRCTYCDFYTNVAPHLIPSFVESIVIELQKRVDYLTTEPVTSIYFGGGTPSLLTAHHFQLIFQTINTHYLVEESAEITFEANPDDLTSEYLTSISTLPFNRISIGIQSFNDADLLFINRRHTANQAIQAVKNAQQFGFDNISIDLIYGLPFQTEKQWEQQLDIAFSLNVQHISAYGLTYEEDTVLWKMREKGKVQQVDDDVMNAMYALLLDKAKSNDFEAYEISNFAKKDFRSRHNSSYWKMEKYLGIGPSAHSYNSESRQWNVASITEYTNAIRNNSICFELEELTINDKYNDYVMVSLRTADGADMTFLESLFGIEFKNYFLDNAQQYISDGMMQLCDNHLQLTSNGVRISNLIISDLMKV